MAEQRPKGGQGLSHADFWVKSFSDRGNKGKGPEVEVCLVCSVNQKASVAGME